MPIPESRKGGKAPCETIKIRTAGQQIFSIENQFSPSKGSSKGENKIIKEVSKASRSLIKNHILLKVRKPWRIRWESMKYAFRVFPLARKWETALHFQRANAAAQQKRTFGPRRSSHENKSQCYNDLDED